MTAVVVAFTKSGVLVADAADAALRAGILAQQESAVFLIRYAEGGLPIVEGLKQVGDVQTYASNVARGDLNSQVKEAFASVLGVMCAAGTAPVSGVLGAFAADFTCSETFKYYYEKVSAWSSQKDWTAVYDVLDDVLGVNQIGQYAQSGYIYEARRVSELIDGDSWSHKVYDSNGRMVDTWVSDRPWMSTDTYGGLFESKVASGWKLGGWSTPDEGTFSFGLPATFLDSSGAMVQLTNSLIDGFLNDYVSAYGISLGDSNGQVNYEIVESEGGGCVVYVYVNSDCNSTSIDKLFWDFDPWMPDRGLNAVMEYWEETSLANRIRQDPELRSEPVAPASVILMASETGGLDKEFELGVDRINNGAEVMRAELVDPLSFKACTVMPSASVELQVAQLISLMAAANSCTASLAVADRARAESSMFLAGGVLPPLGP